MSSIRRTGTSTTKTLGDPSTMSIPPGAWAELKTNALFLDGDGSRCCTMASMMDFNALFDTTLRDTSVRRGSVHELPVGFHNASVLSQSPRSLVSTCREDAPTKAALLLSHHKGFKLPVAHSADDANDNYLYSYVSKRGN